MRPLLALAFLVSGLACADDFPDPSTVDGALQARAEQMAQGFQGAYVVVKEGRVVAIGGVGRANRETGEANGYETSFRLASVTKPLTATAVMQLVEAGLLDTEKTVGEYLEGFGATGTRVKLHHLLTHSSGLPDYVDALGTVSSPDEVIDWIRRRSPQFEPGSRFSYSNSNYSLLGALIEKASGVRYGEYMEANVFARARMTHSGYDFPSHPGTGFAAPSGGDPGAFWEPTSKAYAAGALYASALDMARFGHALVGGLLVDPRSLRRMHTAYVGGYGYGFRVSGDRVSHDGVIPGFTSQLILYPKKQGLVMTLSNGSAGAPGLAGRLVALLEE